MTRATKNPAAPVVAIEIRCSTLTMALIEPAGADGTQRVRTRLVRWRHEAHALHSQRGMDELTAALKTIVAEEKLAGAEAHLTLNGDYCVTRVVTGSTDRVRPELGLLEQRSEVYLSLGPGPKSRAATTYELDSRHEHALLTVTNTKTLDAVLDAAAAVGLRVTRVEPSLVALCRLLGYAGHDTDGPALIIGFSERSVELGISYRGRLLLDYRPGGRCVGNEIADIVLRHLTRLRRYCDRHYRYARGQLARVFLCGPSEAVEPAVSQFRQQGQLTVQPFDPTAINSHWRFGGGRPDSEFCAALGTCLLSAAPDQSAPGPNLMERVRAEDSRPLWRTLWGAFWPVAAVLLVAIGVYAVNRYEQAQCGRLIRNLDVIESSAAELWKLRREMAETGTRIGHLQALAEHVSVPSWERMLSTAAHCMPEDLWLDKITADAQGKVTLAGNSFREATIYRFVGYLEASPDWSHVAVEGTWPASTKMGRTTKFDIQSEFDNCNTCSEDPNRND